jgi:hypothetical protein
MRRHPLLTILMVIIGAGLCSIWGRMAITGIDRGGAQDPRMIALWAICFAISVAGILLLRRALRR